MSTSLPALQTLLGDRYQLERELGQGGMATVYLARDVKQDRLVAVKVLHPDLGMALGPERFRREIDVASRLSHPHILAVDDYGGTGDALYYVMPFVSGESLHARLKREGQFPVEDAVRITCQVASALDHAHKMGVVHRDVKPENILLENGQAMLADFGIARAISESGDERLTKTGLTLGTPTYMSPEQAVAERNIDGRSDVYSLGCVLYEMLAGQPPFTGPTAQSIIARHTLSDVPSITIVRGTVPDEVEDAIMRALAKVPADRFATAGEFADALEHSLETRGRSLGRTDRRSRSRRPKSAGGKRAARIRAAAAVLGVLVLAVGGWVGWRTYAQRQAAAAAGDADGLPARRIGVLYFEDLSPGRTLGHVADGLTEELIGQLEDVQGLDVVSRNGMAAFRDSEAPDDSIARVLGAGTLVRGSIETAGPKLKVTVRLVDGASGADLGKRASFDYPATDVLAIRDTLAQRVARVLRARLGEEIRLRQTRQATSNVAAWSLAQRAEKALKDAEALHQRSDTGGMARAYATADSLLARAEALDPRWAGPVVRRGGVALRRARLARDPVTAAREVDAGLAHAQRALALDPRDPEALELRGTLRYTRWNRRLTSDPREMAALLGQAEADLEQAVKAAPALASAWGTLSLVHYQKPDLVEATLAARRAYEADAYLSDASMILWRLYTTAYDGESFLEAVRWCDEGQRRFPDDARFVRCQLWLFTTNAREADPAAAWKLVDRLKAMTPEREWQGYAGREASMLAAAAVGRAGDKDSASRVLVRARGGPDVDPDRELLTVEAFVRDRIGQRDEALEVLKQYIAAKPEHRAGFAVSQSWWWRELRSDPRYKLLMGIRE